MDARNQFGPQRMQYMWVARITREMSLLGPAAIQMIAELLTKLQSQKEAEGQDHSRPLPLSFSFGGFSELWFLLEAPPKC